jgi:hypothetical protein
MNRYVLKFESYKSQRLKAKRRKKRIEAWKLAHPPSFNEGDPVNPNHSIPEQGVVEI